MDSPNKCDLNIAVLNLLTSTPREASIRFILLIASTHVDAGSQQFENLGPYVTSDRITATASVKIAYWALSAIEYMDFTTPMQFSREIGGRLLGLSPYIVIEMLQTTVLNLIVEAMPPPREILFHMTSKLKYYWLKVQACTFYTGWCARILD
jgi:hypothetical protein